VAKFYFLIIIIFSLSIQVAVAKTINDPTKPKLQKVNNKKNNISSKSNKQQLTAIFLKKGNYQAIINDKLYRRGDFFNNKKIIAIKSNKVLLKNEHGTSHLTLISPFKKQKKN